MVAWALALLVSGGVVAAAQSPANVSSLDLAGFVSEMDRLTNALAVAEPRDVPRILTTMPHTYQVRDGQQQFDVPFEPFAQRLSAARASVANWATQRQELVGDLRVVRSEAAALMAARTPSPDPRATLTAILSRREFAAGRNAEWGAALRRRLTEWLESIWRRLGGDRVNSRTTAFVLATLAIVIGAVSLAVWLIRRSAPAHGSATGAANGSRLVVACLGGARDRTAARSGDAREAARCGYRAALRRLEEQGIWQIDESRTAREYLRLLKPERPDA